MTDDVTLKELSFVQVNKEKGFIVSEYRIKIIRETELTTKSSTERYLFTLDN